MLFTVRRAVRYYRTKPEVWRTLQIRGMQGNYSWDASADTYVELYMSILPKAEAAEAVVEEAPVVEEKKPAAKRTRKAPAKKAAEAPAEEAPAAEKKPAAKRTRKTAAKKVEE